MASSDASDGPRSNTAPDLPPGVTKEILKAAPPDSWGRPQKLYEVTVHYVGSVNETGEEFASTRSEDEPLTFTLGMGYMVRGWDFAVATMRRGEVSRFTLLPELAYGDVGQPPTVPPNSTVVFEIELVSWSARHDLFGDGGAIRWRIERGEGHDRPKADDEVIMSLRAVDVASGETIEERKEFEYTMGSGLLGPLGKVADKALRSMRKGGSLNVKCTKDYAYGDEWPDGVVVTLRLEEIYQTDNVSWFKNTSILKKRTKEGQGHGMPKEGDKVKLRVEAATNGTEVLPGFLGPTLLDFVWGNGEISEALEMAARKMSVGERALVTCAAPSLCCDTKLGLAGIRAKKVVFAVELVDVEQEASEELPQEFRLEFLLERKEIGGRLFKEQRFLMAYYRYQYVVKALASSGKGWNDECAGKAKELQCMCQLNMAACLLKVGDNKGAIAACNRVLESQRQNVKAFFRRATAYHDSGEYMLAIRDLNQVLELEPLNADARRLLQQSKQAQRNADNASKASYTKMFTAGGGKSGTESARA